MKELTLILARLEARSRLLVGRGLLAQLPHLLNLEGCSSVAVVADRGAQQHAQSVVNALGINRSLLMPIDGGEHCKTVHSLELLWDLFAQHKLDRRSVVLTLGGGATSDLVGFAAATYMRGIRFVHIPTTLLAQVDASIGGKSGINFRGVKNLIGSILQPSDVIIDIDTLDTLPPREIRSGFAEIAKHGLIADAAYFEHVTSRHFDAWSPEELSEIIFRSCQIKQQIVQSDESEQGARKTLNFGHTVGHAVEALSLESDDPLTHGEAVAIGMLAEARISHHAGLLSEEELAQIKVGLTRVGLPTAIPENLDPLRLRSLMAQDKKNVAGQIRWTLLKSIGQAVYDQGFDEHYIAETLLSSSDS